jgi:hypothetical protein
VEFRSLTRRTSTPLRRLKRRMFALESLEARCLFAVDHGAVQSAFDCSS